MKKTQPLNNGLTPKELTHLRNVWERLQKKGEVSLPQQKEDSDCNGDADDNRWNSWKEDR